MNIASKSYEIDTVRCSECATENSTDFIYCIECDKVLRSHDERYYSVIKFPWYECPNCHESTPNNGKFC